MPRWNNHPFTCSNARYRTDTFRGYPHGPDQAGGSVFPAAVFRDQDGYTLWLEYVMDSQGAAEFQAEPSWLWLMWYDPMGEPTISQSATFDLAMLREIVSRSLRFT